MWVTDVSSKEHFILGGTVQFSVLWWIEPWSENEGLARDRNTELRQESGFPGSLPPTALTPRRQQTCSCPFHCFELASFAVEKQFFPLAFF